MVENEFKVMLTKEQYEAIHEMYQWDGEKEQVNHYYDTAELTLIKSHVTCRVRFVDGRYLLQMKLPNGADYSRIELEEDIGDTLPDGFDGERLSAFCGRSGMPDVRLLGELKTLRSVKELCGAEIDLDRSSYFGKTDHELEIEFTDEAVARTLLADIKQKACINEKSDVCLGKIHRFIEEYNRR